MGRTVRLPPSLSRPARRRRPAEGGTAAARPARAEHPVETLQRTIGNRATTLLIQRRAGQAEEAPGATALRPDASQDELHAEYVRGKELYDTGRFTDAVVVWTGVYAHPMMRGNTQRRAGLAFIIGRANERGDRIDEAITWYHEVISAPGATAEDVAGAREALAAARRGSNREAGLPTADVLPPDATDEDLHAAYLDAMGMYHAGLWDEAGAKLVSVYEHPKFGVHRRDEMAIVIGASHFHAHRFDRAISWFEEAMQTEGADPVTVAEAEERIAKCRRGSTEAAGVAVRPPLRADAPQDELHAQYLEGDGLYRAGLFDEAVAVWVPVYEHPNVGDDRRGPLGIRIGMAHHHRAEYRRAISWYTEALARGGLLDVDAVRLHRRLAQARAEKPLTSPETETRPTIAQGWTGKHVRHLQASLEAYGFDLRVDGIFGPETARLVREFQAKNGLTPDGIVGPRSWIVLS